MNENFNNKLTINLSNGKKLIINVLDIIDSDEFNKTFIIYTLKGKDDQLFSSILNETDNSFSLETITSKEEIDFINNEIESYINEEVEA